MALRKRGGTFLICFRMRYPEKGGSLRKGGFQPWRKLWTTEKLCKPRGHEHKNPMLPVLQAVCCGNHERIENPVTHLRWSI